MSIHLIYLLSRGVRQSALNEQGKETGPNGDSEKEIEPADADSRTHSWDTGYTQEVREIEAGFRQRWPNVDLVGDTAVEIPVFTLLTGKTSHGLFFFF